MKIGVLALQGAVREHLKHIELSGHEGIAVKHVEQLKDIDGLILPGGESTTLRRLMNLYGFKEALQQSDLPMFGTCAGLIVMAKDIVGEEGYLNKLDISVQRNSFGRQVDSFESELDVKDVAADIEGVFIRAPHIAEVHGNVSILSKIGEKIVAVQEGRYLGVSFHPELTDDYRITRYFINHIVKTTLSEKV
ncbi:MULTISPECIES: pyridoxal 5'-phosphate synthase glutaminase subunit PdxT [Staphylococcus]|jgi:5'-phosphate synthase pdxT subunit|uniref:Pyridoxal 5'-phosphate synthase subunit PdxT n=1 Tax=Staphylococcus nepalensis TaxID=214473 RepID=A0A291JNP4_9STAP|nr:MULTISPECIES: pyridoxal 5'-phosphate synthase glutaminase subunit PdxT [Staphylococcus]VDG68072.1 glutamine amidotransferase subunit PdxT [Lacrimispora indolis]ATH61058.1 glutamine amidotransferase subunit PdxT [Staphylococcus nepalensis]ATH66088.1 glutamine amidotransferase subunit PdxT [Staphylococcus nepalensis]AWI45478.1 glutamine amidotransferase subunit PdxT [Staphylococcus nepalensis]MBO1206351.1 pyridoxal 5'-phosphate synthase glutaminase subunit PdxT [Staphylococcus nepalensis]